MTEQEDEPRGAGRMQEPKAGRRIVSKGEYAKAQGKRTSAGLFGVGMYVGSVICGLLALFTIPVLLQVVSLYNNDPDTAVAITIATCVVVFLAFCAGAWLLRKLGLRIIKQAKEIDTGIPLTRANTADLPAPDSLVRASQEPAQAQEGVLLRAATVGQERHEEQLLRASAGGQE